MTFDFQRALGFAMVQRYNPSPIPPAVGPTWYAPGWCSSIYNPPGDLDPNHSYGWHGEAGKSATFPAGRSFISPARSHGSDFLGDSFDSGLPNGWTYIQQASGVVGLISVSDPDPAVSGNALDLKTNGTVGAIAGIQKTIGAVTDTFGVMLMPKLENVGTNPADGLQVWIQNNVGKTLMLRFSNGLTEVNINGIWTTLLADATRPGNFFWEVWVMCHDNGPGGGGSHTVSLYSGTALVASVTGIMPSNIAFANNSCTIMQRSGANPWRRSQIAQINVGPTQLADQMEAVCWPFAASFVPVTGQACIMVEDVSADASINNNVEFFVTNNNLSNWVKVTMAEVPFTDGPSPWPAAWGRGEVGNMKAIRMYVGTFTFASGGGSSMRWNYKTSQGTFAALQAVNFFWDPPA